MGRLFASFRVPPAKASPHPNSGERFLSYLNKKYPTLKARYGDPGGLLRPKALFVPNRLTASTRYAREQTLFSLIFSPHKKSPSNDEESGDSGAIRTLDLLLRRQLLYPAELRSQRLYFTRFFRNRQEDYLSWF